MTWDHNKDFWELHPHFAVLEDFRKIKRKKSSSLLMWAIAYIWSTDSPIANYPHEEKVAEIKEWYKKDIPEDIIKAYKKLCISTNERLVLECRIEIEELLDFSRSIVLEKGNVAHMDIAKGKVDLQAKLNSALKHLERAEKELIKEKQKRGNRGGYPESFSEKI